MNDFLKELRSLLDNTSQEELLAKMSKYDIAENNVGPTMAEFLASRIDCEIKSGVSKGFNKVPAIEVFELFAGKSRGQSKEEQERNSLWTQAAGIVITGQQFRRVVGDTGIDVEVISSSFVGGGKGNLFRNRNKIVLQVNQAAFDLMRTQKDIIDIFDELRLTILPFDIGINFKG